MARSHWIMQRADAACGRALHPDRPTAETYRIALAFRSRATGGDGAGCWLAVYLCKRCFAFHIARKRIGRGPVEPDRFPPPHDMSREWSEPPWTDSEAMRDVTA